MKKFVIGFLATVAFAGTITQKLNVTSPLTGSGSVVNPLSCPSCSLSGGTPGFSPNGLISGGGVAWTGNLDFTVSAAQYLIAGNQYSSAQTDLTLTAAHATLDRIDLIIVDSSGVATFITGTPAMTPQEPSYDPATQLPLTFVYVAATATTPSNVATTLLYDENVGAATEWNTTVTANFNAGSTNNPYHLTKDTEATTAATGNNLQLQKGAGTVALNTVNNLVFYIRSKATWGNNRSLNIYFANAGTQVGTSVLLANGAFGFTSGQTSTYQQIVVPISLFNTAASAVNQLVFKVAGTGGTLGFYLDWVQLQSGLVQQPGGTPLNWKNTWSSTTSYSVNDIVRTGGTAYVALVGNTNVTPVDGSTWAQLVTPAGAQLHAISFAIDGGGSVISTGDIGFYPPVDFACTISRYDISADQSGSITVDVWKAAGAIPTGANKISASAPMTLSSSQLNQNGSRSGWTNSVAVGDVFGFSVATSATVTKVTGVIWCQ